MGITIEDLNAAVAADLAHAIPATKDDETVKLTVAQIVDLMVDEALGGDDAFAATMADALLALSTSKADAVQATVDVASAATTNLAGAASWNVRITGTTGPITSFGTAPEGTLRFVRIQGIVQINHGTAIVLPGAANITSAANDCFIAKSLGSGNWIVLVYQKATPVKGLIQTQAQYTGAVATGSTVIPDDDTIPQNTEGDQYLTVTITPTNAASILEIDAQFISSLSTGAVRSMALFQNGVANALEAVQITPGSAGLYAQANLAHRMVAGTTSPITFTIRAGPASAATLTMNGGGGARKFGGVMNSYIQVKEYTP
ncbi:hypothetical protein [Rhizobium sp. Nf11,1]|uniref:hypothetical protein n=1 Tax=Rhizobium sp. Nf11,1 TaxID=3404923 RepID=UPI003D3416C1